jgi:hypothetical protein
MAAHGLAKEMTCNNINRIWLEEVSQCIFDIVNLERLALAL